MTPVLCLLGLALVAEAPADDRPPSALTAIHWASLPDEVRGLATKFVAAGKWRERSSIGQELAARGDAAVEAWLAILETSDDHRLLGDAFYHLRRQFPDHAQTKEYILTQGLRSAHESIRYESLFHVGEQKWPEAREQLYAHLGKKKDQPDSWSRFVAAKSLGELGDTRALPTLIEAVQHDRYMPRHFGNLGLKGLTGKSLEDFNYSYGEGAHVSGGREMLFLNHDPILTADFRARRYTAYRDFLQWLRDNRAEMYEMLTTPQF
jgi:hypothetical protein